MQNNPYQAYAQGSVLSSSPLKLVTMSYEKTIECIRQAKSFLETGDVLGRSRVITKSVEILTELMISLDMEKGGDVAVNLKRLYSYMQQRLLEAHTKKSSAFLTEVEGLLSNLLEAWYTVAEKNSSEVSSAATYSADYTAYPAPSIVEEDDMMRVSYAGYYSEPMNSYSGLALSF